MAVGTTIVANSHTLKPSRRDVNAAAIVAVAIAPTTYQSRGASKLRFI
jgi:predicted rRNA methylase YqxC with S4 and FtsJ domains